MEERDFVAELTREGFSDIFVWEDGPNVDYPEHTHRAETAHIILSGEIQLNAPGIDRVTANGSVLRGVHISSRQNRLHGAVCPHIRSDFIGF